MTNQDTRDNFSALYEVTQSINSILDPQLLLDKVLEIAMLHLSAERGFIILSRDSSSDAFDVATSRNVGSTQATGELAASSSVVRNVLSTGEPVLTFDALADERFESSTSIIAQNILSILCIPLRLRERVTGAVYLDSTKSRRMFNDESLRFLSVFGNLAATAIENARQFDSLKDENRRLRTEADPSSLFKGVIGKNKRWKDILDVANRVTDVDVAVLIVGESGTGKEVLARAIHEGGTRKRHPFVAVNCSAIPEQLMESEFFGHMRGSFTGAHADKKGLFEIAEQGTLFLDEIGELPQALQTKLLRALEDKEIRRVGDVQTRKTNARIIAATNKDLQNEIQHGRFREDLFFRLNVVRLHLPPLRDRKEDIPLLAEYFFDRACTAHKRRLSGIHPDAMSFLLRSPWPGNIRELQNTIERAVVLCKGEFITSDDVTSSIGTPTAGTSRDMTLADHERTIIESTLQEMGGNRTRAAEKLGVSLRWLQYRLKEWSNE